VVTEDTECHPDETERFGGREPHLEVADESFVVDRAAS
jgi:hypothetical protein